MSSAPRPLPCLSFPGLFRGHLGAVLLFPGRPAVPRPPPPTSKRLCPHHLGVPSSGPLYPGHTVACTTLVTQLSWSCPHHYPPCALEQDLFPVSHTSSSSDELISQQSRLHNPHSLAARSPRNGSQDPTPNNSRVHACHSPPISMCRVPGFLRAPANEDGGHVVRAGSRMKRWLWGRGAEL